MSTNNYKQWWLNSKIRVIYTLVGSLAFVGLGIYLIFTSDKHVINPTLVTTIGVVTVLFSGMVAFFSLKKINNKKD